MANKKGRPARSGIRDNIVELLYFMKRGYGYEVFKVYRALFPPVTMRSIYYHLKKGAELGIFELAGVERSKGNYSWGPEAEKLYYKLGEKAAPKGDERVRVYLTSKTQRPEAPAPSPGL